MSSVNAEPSSSILKTFKTLVVSLGSFHARMSYIGCIVYIMPATGLTEVLEQIYESNTVKHILTGHAVARAMRVHSIVDLSIKIMLLMNLYNTHSDNKVSDIVYP